MLPALNETEAETFEKQRLHEILNDRNSLGPDDMVRIEKLEVGCAEPVTSSHHVIGIEMDSPDAFSKYYQQIGSLVTQQNQRPGNRQRKLVSGRYNCFNSFQQIDAVVEITEDGEVVSTYEESAPDWRELRLSCILRYYRARFPVVSCVFGGEPVFAKYLNVVPVRATLAREDIDFIRDNHPVSNEFLEAFARLLVVSLDTAGLVSFIEDVEHKLPQILPVLVSLLPPSVPILEALYFYAEHHWSFFPDDVAMACMVANHYVNNGKAEDTHKFVPLLSSVIWDVPAAGITLARICCAEKKYRDAFEYLNAAAYSTSWPVRAPEDDMISTPEKRLLRTPMTGPYSDYFDAILELYSAIGRDKFLELVQQFGTSRDTSSLSFATQPKQPFCQQELNSTLPDELFLYDPGIAEDPAIQLNRNTPFADPFQDMIKAVTTSISKHEKLCARRVTIANDSTGNLVTAIKLKDKKTIKQIFDYLKKSCTATVADYVLMYKASLLGLFDVDHIDVTHLPPSFTPLQRACLSFLGSFIPQICHFH